MRISACVSAVFPGKPLPEAVACAASAGARCFEFWSWWDQDIDGAAAACEAHGMTAAALCTRFIPLTDPSCREAYLEGLLQTMAVCQKLDCQTIISQVGPERAGVVRQAQHESIVQGLRAAAPMLEDAGMSLVIEPLNTKVDHAGYYLARSQEAFDIVGEVASPNVKVLYDLYHQHVTGDLRMDSIARNIDRIGHFHMAGYPGRHEPGVANEIDYDALIPAIAGTGYQGFVGLEYGPVGDPEESLRGQYAHFTRLLP